MRDGPLTCRHLVFAAVLLVSLCCSAGAVAAPVPRVATMNGAGWNEFDQVNASTGSIVPDRSRSYEGGQSARATFSGGANGYERGIFNVDWPEGSDVWYGAAFYLPSGFKTSMQGQVDIMRWDNFGALGTNDHRSGVVIHRDGTGSLMRMKFGVENIDIGQGFEIPEGRWFWLEVHQRLSRTDGTALSEVYIDDRRVSSTTTANMYGTAADRVRYGVVAIDQNRQTTPLTLWFDRAGVSATRMGSAGAPADPPSGSAPTRSASMEQPGFGEFDDVGVTAGALQPERSSAYDGEQAANATVDGGGNGYARGTFDVDWHDGQDVWYGAAYYLPGGFKAAMQGQVDLLRWDSLDGTGQKDSSGVVIHRNGMGNLMRTQLGVAFDDVGSAFEIPEGRWFWLEVHQRLGRTDGQALSEVYLDGRRVATTTAANTYGRPAARVHYGLVAVDAVRQAKPLTLLFDRATIAPGPVGPGGGAGAPGTLAPAPSVVPRTASLEGELLGELDRADALTGQLAADASQAYEGAQSARATVDGGADGYARGAFNVGWHDGDDVWYGAAYLLPGGFKAAMQGQVDLLRWDSLDGTGQKDSSGVVIHRDGTGSLVRQRLGVESVDLGPAFEIPEGRWFSLQVHQRLSHIDGIALSEVYVDGVLVSTSRTADTYGGGVERVQYGLVAIDAARQGNPLTLWFDRPSVSTGPIGAIGGGAP